MTIVLPRLHPSQLAVARDPSRYRIVVAGRRWGKTRLAVAEAIRAAGQGGSVWWVAPTYDMARAGWDAMLSLLLPVPGLEIHRADRMLRLPGRGSIWVRSGDDPQKLRAHSIDLVVLDEAAFLRREIWAEVIRPALADRQGRAILISTPHGRNWFWELVQTAQHSPGWRVWRFSTADNPLISREELEAMRREMPAHLYAQEIEAEFIEPAGALVRAEWFRYGSPPEGSPTYMGVDLAISRSEGADYSAIVVMARDKEGRWYVMDAVHGRWTFHETLNAIQNVAGRYRPAAIAVEAVQYQMAVVHELLRLTALPVRAVKPKGSKQERAQILALRYEQGLIYHAQPLPEYERELRDFPYGAHDDMVDAAVYALMAGAGHGLDYADQVRMAAR